MKLVTANSYFRRSTNQARLRHWWPRGIPLGLPEETSRNLSVPAVVNHGRWIVRCPFCLGAQFADEEDPRFFCVDCLFAGTDAEGKWVIVKWPTERARAAIESVLVKRRPANRNWQGEPLAVLKAENLENGIGA